MVIGVRMGCQSGKCLEMSRLRVYLRSPVSDFDTCCVRLADADRPKADSMPDKSGVNRLEDKWLEGWHTIRRSYRINSMLYAEKLL